jgi:uncharacterized protein (DUF1330 family)
MLRRQNVFKGGSPGPATRLALLPYPCGFIKSKEESRMPAYIIVDIEVHDTAVYDEYRKVVGATLQKYDGKFVVRGGKTEVLEGNWNPKRVVVLEFENVARAKEWYDSEEYKVPKQMRMKASKGNLLLVEGV